MDNIDKEAQKLIDETKIVKVIYAFLDRETRQLMTFGNKVKAYINKPKKPIPGQLLAEFVRDGEAEPKIWYFFNEKGNAARGRGFHGTPAFQDAPAFASEVDALSYLQKKIDQAAEQADRVAKSSNPRRFLHLDDDGTNYDVAVFGFSKLLDDPRSALPQGTLTADGVWLLQFIRDTSQRIEREFRSLSAKEVSVLAPISALGTEYLIHLDAKKQADLRAAIQEIADRHEWYTPRVSSQHGKTSFQRYINPTKNSRDLLRKYGFRHDT